MSSCNGFSSLIYIEFLEDNELEAGDTDTGRGNSSCETPSNGSPLRGSIPGPGQAAGQLHPGGFSLSPKAQYPL
ncbi:unnamed protein product [Brassica oleracea var. botrytis]|uniref:Uncharacterized protein n=2 Tax=Brassica TaxID=3705 RepID=A0A0D3C121_BRAOL|nr:unnamed protein product [Brassica napus]